MNTLNPQQVAQGLAALGRGRDTMLMHVTPREVAGLQSLALAAGGSLSVNPDTGLPEAGFFDFIADYIVPTALTLSGNPHLAVAYSGGKSYLETGDPLQALLSAGMQYGANAFGNTLMKTATPLEQGLSTGVNAARTAGDAALNVAGSAGTQSGSALINAGQEAAENALTRSLGTAGIPGGQGTPGGFSGKPSAVSLPTTVSDTGVTTALNLKPSLTDTFSQNLSTAGSGIKNLLGPGGVDKFVTAAGGTGPALFQAGSAAMPAINALTPEPEGPPSTSLGFGPFTPISELRNRYADRMGYAQGGVASLNPMHGMFDARNANREFGEPMGGYKKGGYLDGPGDGMSDSIPATIEGRQPARLADGEFVVPADVVSHLGNGSTKAGAQRLYDMMDRVRKARTGRTKQGKQIKADKYLPK